MSSRNPITIEVLETLDAIDRRGSYAKAAEELNKATSAVSYAVQKLEEQLDIALFQRQGRRSVLTPAGQLILQEGRKILLATSRLANTAKE
ncbi:MAG: DNA-binding transcriptional LysR family regulator, partial [Oleispira sp.]